MSLLQVLKFPNKHLKEMSKSVEKVNSRIQDLVRDMFETMYVENGIGLAAPQVDERLRLIVVDVPIVDPNDPEVRTADPVALINPKIIEAAGVIQYEEGCLSCPELSVLVDRNSDIRVSYLDPEGRPMELNASGLKAVCIQHEIDHLNGILLVDKLSRLKRDLYKTERVKVLRDEKEALNIL